MKTFTYNQIEEDEPWSLSLYIVYMLKCNLGLDQSHRASNLGATDSHCSIYWSAELLKSLQESKDTFLNLENIIFQVVVVERFHSITPSLPIRHFETRGTPIWKGKGVIS